MHPQPVFGVARRDQPDHRCADDIGAGREELRHLFDRFRRSRLALRGVNHAVGTEVHQRIDIVGSDDAGWFVQSTQLRRVLADLLSTGGVHSDQFEIWPADDRPQRMSAYVSGGELNDSAHDDLILEFPAHESRR